MELSTTKWMDLFHAALDCVPKIKVRSANSVSWRDSDKKLKSLPPFTSGQHSEGVGRNSSPSSNGNVQST